MKSRYKWIHCRECGRKVSALNEKFRCCSCQTKKINQIARIKTEGPQLLLSL